MSGNSRTQDRVKTRLLSQFSNINGIMSKSRNWCFTINNWTDNDCRAMEGAEYTVVGKETGEAGTPHLQGFCHFTNQRTFNGVKRIHPTAHWEEMHGNIEQAIEYCKKDGQWHEWGEKPKSQAEKGTANADRWRDIIDLSRAGDFESIKEKYPDVYATRLPQLENLRRKRPREMPQLNPSETEHQWIWGDTGLGKTRSAIEENPGAYIKDPQTKWWDGYDGQEVVIIDDFDVYQKAQGGMVKRWADIYPFQAEVKNGQMLIRPNKVIITSQYHPSEIWEDEKTVDAIMRRFWMVHLMEPAGRRGSGPAVEITPPGVYTPMAVERQRVPIGPLTRMYGQNGRVTGPVVAEL